MIKTTMDDEYLLDTDDLSTTEDDEDITDQTTMEPAASRSDNSSATSSRSSVPPAAPAADSPHVMAAPRVGQQHFGASPSSQSVPPLDGPFDQEVPEDYVHGYVQLLSDIKEVQDGASALLADLEDVGEDMSDENSYSSPSAARASTSAAIVTNRTQVRSEQASSCQQNLPTARNLFPDDGGDTKHHWEQQQQQQQLYKNDFVFPENISLPSAEALRVAHDQAVLVGDPSHQFQLTRAGTNLLSLQEVILPSIYGQISSALKEKQAIAQRNAKDGMPDHQGNDVVEVIEACRKLAKRCIGEAMKKAGESWRQREKSRMERHLALVEQRKAAERQAKQERKNERALARQARHDSAKESAMHDPRNIALHDELAMLEKALDQLKLEEEKWKTVNEELSRAKDTPNGELMELDPVVQLEDTSMEEQVSNTPLEQITESMIEETTEAVNYLGGVFKTITSTMKQSEELNNAVKQYRFGEGELVMESARARRRRLGQERDEDGSVQYDNNGDDNVNDMMVEVEEEEDESDTTAPIEDVEDALDQLSLQHETRTSIAQRTRSRSIGNGEEPMAPPREARSRSRGPTRDNASSSTPVAQRTRRSLSRGRTENDEGGTSASSSTPVARRSQQITSPLLSPIPIEKDSKRVQEEVDTTLDTVELTDVSDDTVQYDDEDSSSTSISGAMIFNPTCKYDGVCPRSLEAILESLDVTKEELQKYPLLYDVLTTFHTEEIEPAKERERAANAQNAQGLSDAAAAVDEEEDEASDEEENVWTAGSTIHLDDLENLPQDCAVLGLHRHHSTAMDENPKTEGHAYLVQLIQEYSEQFQSVKHDPNNTRNDVVMEMFNDFVEKYDFIVLSKVADSEGEPKYVVEKSDFVKDASLCLAKDTGSIRLMLYKKLSNYHISLGNNYLANVQQEKIDYFKEMLPKCTLTLGYESAKDFTPHNKLPDEERKDPNFGADEHDSTLENLKETYPRPTVPSEGQEETGQNSHLMPIEVAIINRDLIEHILSLHNDYANRDKWEKIRELVDAIPSQLQALFVWPDLKDHPSRRVGEYLINLIKVLSQQCGMSGYKISECGSIEELASLELDHITKYFRKSHNCTHFDTNDTTSHRNPFGLDAILKRALYEAFKCRLLHFMWHPRGNSMPSEAKLQERMCRKLVLTYDDQIDKVLGLFKEQGERQSVTFREFCQIEEFVLLMLDWVSRGAFRATKKPLVSYKALAIAPMKLFHVSLDDMMKYTEAEYNQLHCTTRVKAITNAISTLMARLSGGCSRHTDRGCKLNRAEMNSGQLQASMEMNHRKPNAKDKGMSALKKCPVKWCKEGIRGDCENECRCCHKKINAFQSGGPKPPGYTGS
mmetsp:Transcript_26383/g.42880  ORF Transcript_26383/g.42880 Transcript_26383/m.42880 type:complete len:1350 (+) Transcript_26383:183-4232(+)